MLMERNVDRATADEGHAEPVSARGLSRDFVVQISNADLSGESRTIVVERIDETSDVPMSRTYTLPHAQHSAYLDVFASLARDFGTRVPRNRQVTGAPTFHAPFQPLLTANLSADMLYGYGDPAVIRVPAGEAEDDAAWYYVVVTSNDAPQSFPIARSRDLRSWELVGFAFPQGWKPRWAADGERVSDYWAPEMHLIGGVFRLYFAAREKDSGALAIGVATATSPDGPFLAAEEPLLRGDVIDPHVVIDRQGTPFLLWKEDANGLWPTDLMDVLYTHEDLITELFPSHKDRLTASFLRALWPWARRLASMERFCVQQVLIEAVIADFEGFVQRLASLPTRGDAALCASLDAIRRALKTPVYGQRLTQDGLRLIGEPVTVLENDQSWEAHLVEGVWVQEHAGRYYLFYSGNDFSTAEYGVGVAIADAPLGPYRKMNAPLLRSTADWSGPGHPSVANGLDGEPQLFLHAYFPGHGGYKEFRALLTIPVTLAGDTVTVRPPMSPATVP